MKVKRKVKRNVKRVFNQVKFNIAVVLFVSCAVYPVVVHAMGFKEYYFIKGLWLSLLGY